MLHPSHHPLVDHCRVQIRELANGCSLSRLTSLKSSENACRNVEKRERETDLQVKELDYSVWPPPRFANDGRTKTPNCLHEMCGVLGFSLSLKKDSFVLAEGWVSKSHFRAYFFLFVLEKKSHREVCPRNYDRVRRLTSRDFAGNFIFIAFSSHPTFYPVKEWPCCELKLTFISKIDVFWEDEDSKW